MRIAIVGAAGRLGRCVVGEARRRGHEVTAVVSDPSAVDLGEGVAVVAADATDPEALAAAVAGHGAVVSVVGPRGEHDVDVLSRTARALLDGLERAAVRRLVVAGGAGSLEVAPGMRLVDTPDFPAPWKAVALAHADALDVYRQAETEVDWSYASPGAVLEPGARTGSYRLGGDRLLTDDAGNSHISMEDFAIALVDECEQGRHVRRRFTAAD